jgi:hypothetical protein
MRTIARIPARHVALALAVAALAPFVPATNAGAATTLTFNTSPLLGTLSALTLNGRTQTTTTSTTLNDFAVTSSGTNAGWNMTVASVTGAGKSSVFKEYCPNATCGSDTGPGYVTGGYTLPADSLTINTTGASISGGTGTKPAFQCGSGCNVDTTTATKILSATTAASLAEWTAAGTSTLTLTTPANLHKLQTNETYRINLVWTLNSGP